MPPKNRNRNSHPRQPAHHLASDYDTDTAYATDTMTTATAPPIPPRTNEELNLSVLQRHNPSIHQILSVAPFAVVYTFNTTTSIWEKQGTEGTLFVSSLLPHVGGPQIERYNVTVLNRRGLENFSSELFRASDVEVTDDYVILRVEDGGEDGGGEIYGLWIFAEVGGSTAQMRVVNALIIQECAKRAEDSRDAAAVAEVEEEYVEEELPLPRQQAQVQTQMQTQMHDSGYAQPPQQQQQQQPQPQDRQVNLLDLFKGGAQQQQQQQRPSLASPFQSYNQNQHQHQYPPAAQHQQFLQPQQHQHQHPAVQQHQHQTQHQQYQQNQHAAAQNQQFPVPQHHQHQQHPQHQHPSVQNQHHPAAQQQHYPSASAPPPPGFNFSQAHPQANNQAQTDVLASLFSNARRGY